MAHPRSLRRPAPPSGPKLVPSAGPEVVKREIERANARLRVSQNPSTDKQVLRQPPASSATASMTDVEVQILTNQTEILRRLSAMESMLTALGRRTGSAPVETVEEQPDEFADEQSTEFAEEDLPTESTEDGAETPAAS